MIPSGARLLNLRDGTKMPASPRGHHSAVSVETFVQTGTNIGIALDEMFLLVDIDSPDLGAARDFSSRVCDGGPTWEQQSPRGRHYLFRTPPGWRGTNTKLKGPAGEVFGDLKSLGYVVGPGSIVDGKVYEVTNPVEPREAPDWLLEQVLAADSRQDAPTAPQTGIPRGEHDRFLTSVAGWLRERERLDQDAIEAFLAKGPVAILEDTNEADPYTQQSFHRIARSVSRYPIGEDDFEFTPGELQSADDMELVGPPIAWVVDDFIPRGEVVLMYGRGGIGKSSFGSWLAATVTQRGKRFAYMGTEETAERFIGRAVLAGATRANLYNVKGPNSLMLPRDADKIRTVILLGKLDILYIDAVYSHFQHQEGQNEAIRARTALAPLAEIAHETGCTILGVFHANKAGAYLGSVEMENVARCLLKADRPANGPILSVKVAKTNYPNPRRILRLEGTEQQFVIDGEPQFVEKEDGTRVIMTIVVPTRIDDIADDGDENLVPIPEELDPDTDLREPLKDRVKREIAANPTLSLREIAEICDCSYDYAKKVSSGDR